MAKIYIDNKEYEVQEGKNLLETAISLGLNLPYFCWHPQMGSVGACRQCAVKMYKDENDDQGKIVISCMEEVKDGMRVSIEDPDSAEFRSHIVESLMTNHPHDCPTCDEGGECHLQDMTVMTGHAYRRYRFNKRTHNNQYLGPLINHEMNRCIACYRCVRFYKDYAGGKDLEVLSAHNHVYFGRQSDGVLESEFSGNLVEVCPTGVFTDKTLKEHYSRKWDFTGAPSICNLCSLGCNIIADERYGEIRRIRSRYNYNINGYFICDRGRFGYEYMNSKGRIKIPRVPDDNDLPTKEVSVQDFLKEIKPVFGSDNAVTGIGSARASLESNYALKELVGEENFYTGMSDIEYDLCTRAAEIIKNSKADIYSLKNIEKSECVLILGEDLTNTAPMMALAVRQAVRQKPIKEVEKLKIRDWDDKAVREAVQTDKGPVFTITPGPTKLDEISTRSTRMAPADIASLGYAIAHYIDSKSPLPANLAGEVKDLAKEIAGVMTDAEDVAVISGTSCLDMEVLNAASNIARARASLDKKTGLSFTFPEANSLGLALLGGKKLSDLGNDKAGKKSIIILENDLYTKLPGKETDDLLGTFQNVIVADSIENMTTAKANYLIPVAVLTESDGHLVNNEGRVQRFYPVHEAGNDIQPGWRWMQALADVAGKKELAGRDLFVMHSEAVEKANPIFKGLKEMASHSDYRVGAQKIPRSPHRFSGRTAIHADKTIHEPKPPEDENSPMSFSMEGFHGHAPAPFNPWFWSPGWNSIQSINKYQIETGGELHREFPELLLFKAEENDNKPEYYKPSGEGKKSTDRWTYLPLYHIYGSEELSTREGSLRELMVTPYVVVNPGDADRNKWDESTMINLQVGGESLVVPLKINSGIPEGKAGIPIGVEGVPASGFNSGVSITKIK